MVFGHFSSRSFHSRLPRRETKQRGRIASRRLHFEALEDRRVLSTFTVTNVNDSGPGSLRQALTNAETTVNVGGVPDEIHFNIPGSEVHTLHPKSSLPLIRDPVIIDGYSQPGARPNALAIGDDALLKIEINGSRLPAGTNLFNFSGDYSTVRGLAITEVPYYCFGLGYFGVAANNNKIVGNFIGTDSAGVT